MTRSTIDPDSELMRDTYDYREFMNSFVDGFSSKMFHEGILKEVDMEQLQEYFTNPDDNNAVLSDLTEYFYLTTGEIHIMFELVEALPTLSYKVNSFDKPTNHETYMSTINRTMHRIKHKPLTRDVLKQTASSGTLTGMWLGNKNNLYPYIFDDPTKVFPAYRKNGDWVVQFDLELLDDYAEYYQDVIFSNLAPHVTRVKYEAFKNSLNNSSQYIELPQNRTFVIQTHKLKRNQGLGSGWANSAMFDVLHKRKMKDVERAIANKIINAIAILTIGNAKDPKEFGNTKLSPALKKRVFSGVKKALDKSTSEGIPVVAIPEYATLDFPDVKADGLDGKKFEHTNADILSSLGLSGAITSGQGGNHASSKINLEFFYRRIAVLLEQVDVDMLQKMLNLILPKSQSDNYYLEYDKKQPLSSKESIDVLMKLNDKGFSVKHIIDEMPDMNWEEYLEQTMYEIDELKLYDKLKPYATSHTISSKDGDKSQKSDDDLTDEGAATRDGGKNEY